MSLIDFESARQKEEQRQLQRQARQLILDKAQEEFETRQQQEEAARQRGEHTWMLPSVEARLDADHSTGKKKKKKKDKKKKKKKEKKAKSKKKDSSSSGSESEGDEAADMWVESSTTKSSAAPLKAITPQAPLKAPSPQAPLKAPSPQAPLKAPSPQAPIKGPQLPPQESSSGEPVKRDGWMEMTSLFGTFSRHEIRERDGTSRKKAKEEEEKKKREAAKPGSHALELNPYYKDGGTGLPEQQKATPTPTPQTTGLDAGWLRRALQRAREQAQTEGKSLEEIAAERWGSLARFNELLAEAEGRGKHRQDDARNQERRERRSRSRERDRRRNISRERDMVRNISREGDRDRVINVSREVDRDRMRNISREGDRDRVINISREGDRDRMRNISREGDRDRVINVSREGDRDRVINISREGDRRERRSRSTELDRVRNVSREGDRVRNVSREGDRRRSRSREGDGMKSRSKSQERSRDVRQGRSGSRERRGRSGSRERRGRSKEKRRQPRGRHSSSSSSSSRGSSRSSSRNRSKQGSREDRSREGNPRYSQKLLRPSEEPRKGSAPSLRFQKPGEDNSARSSKQSMSRGPVSSSVSSRWQKKGSQQQSPRECQADRRPPSPSSSSSSSTSSSSSEDEGTSQAPKATTPGLQGAPVTTQPPTATAPLPRPKEAPAATPLTDKEMNDLAAKLMKAELMGNDAQATKLKTRLEAAREVRAAGSGSGGPDGGETSGPTEQQVIVLTRTDSRGVSRPVVGSGAEAGQGKKRSKVKTHGQDGQRDRYFPDDDHYNLKNMFEKEKGTTADDQNAMFEEAAMKNTERLNDEFDIDDMFMSKTALRDNAAKQAERDKKKAIQEHQRVERSLEECQWCFDNKEMPKHLIVALGTKCYLSLPAHQSLTPGHCCIVPIHHISCCVQAEEDLWDEVQNFRKSLVKMFASRDEDCIFFETVKRLRHFPHMVLQCVPLPRETGDMAPIYFKKAIMECEKEWAQNKKLVELKGRDVRRGVPKGLPYFFVDFAMDAGFAHVIEDEQDFPNNFAQEIVGGMLDLDTNLWRKPRRENFDSQRRKVMEFSRWYKEFDPTQEG